jgi:hypothetical protein
MATHRYKCRICKRITEHDEITEFNGLPDFVICGQCRSCGVMGVQLVEDIKDA